MRSVPGSAKKVLVAASDRRIPPPNSDFELQFGDGAAAFLMGDTDVAAVLEGSYHLSSEFLDVWRKPQDTYVQTTEERFLRDEGYMKMIPQAVAGLLKKLKLTPKDITKAAFYATDSQDARIDRRRHEAGSQDPGAESPAGQRGQHRHGPGADDTGGGTGRGQAGRPYPFRHLRRRRGCLPVQGHGPDREDQGQEGHQAARGLQDDAAELRQVRGDPRAHGMGVPTARSAALVAAGAVARAEDDLRACTARSAGPAATYSTPGRGSASSVRPRTTSIPSGCRTRPARSSPSAWTSAPRRSFCPKVFTVVNLDDGGRFYSVMTDRDTTQDLGGDVGGDDLQDTDGPLGESAPGGFGAVQLLLAGPPNQVLRRDYDGELEGQSSHSRHGVHPVW